MATVKTRNNPSLEVKTATPLELTQAVRDISVTERNSFKGCRRRWFLETIENLEPKGVKNWSYDFGTGIHSALEQYYWTKVQPLGQEPIDQALLAFEEWYEKMDLEIRHAGLRSFEAEVRDELLEFKRLGNDMLAGYDRFAEQDDFTICAVEGHWTNEGLKLLQEHQQRSMGAYGRSQKPILHESGRYLVPIVHPETHRRLNGSPYLSARLDLVVYVTRPGLQGFWPLDHKTSSSQPSDRGMDMDDQITGYSYVFWRVTGIMPRGTFFNYLIKQAPKPPRLVREGTALSTAKDQLCLPDDYREALREFDLLGSGGRVTSEKHAECLSALLARGWRPFFQRFELKRNEHEIRMFEKRLVQEYHDMKTVRQDPGRLAYPYLSQYNCPGCPVAPICQAIEDGSDYEDVIEHRYQQAPDRKAEK